MSDTDNKQPRKRLSPAEKLAQQREKLAVLEKRVKEDERKEQEKNLASIVKLLRADGLDTLPVEQWKKAMPAIKAALLPVKVGGEEPSSSTTTPQTNVVTQTGH